MRTYASRVRQPTSPPRKRPLQDLSTNTPAKRPKHNPKPKPLTQLHLSLALTTLRTCSLCSLSYTQGAPDDESLHRSHCARVQRGMEWRKDDERAPAKTREVQGGLKLKNGARGRIVCFSADVAGKLGAKLATLLDTINVSLSAPPLPPSVLRDSKVYLFLLPCPSKSTAATREKIVGCVLAQRISTAMAVAAPAPPSPTHISLPLTPSTSLLIHPAPLPTPLGIPRLFVPTSHRRLGIASHLLTAAATTFVHGCALDPRKGEVAFTQPTGDGAGVMAAWGGGGVRIYEE